jgi:glycosyltransferase involved in cell wall biosynthesis
MTTGNWIWTNWGRRRWQTLAVALLILAAFATGTAGTADTAGTTRRRRRPVVALLVPTLPWLFGPYQRQAYLLSRELHHKGVEVRWMMLAKELAALQERLYVDVDDVLGPLSIPPPNAAWDGKLDHIQFLGWTQSGSGAVTASTVNRVVKKFKIDACILIMDYTRMQRDTDFVVPFIGWVPFHHAQLDTSVAYTLRAFSTVAALAPSSAEIVRRTLNVGSDHAHAHAADADADADANVASPNVYVNIDFVPHIVERDMIRRGGVYGTGLPSAALTREKFEFDSTDFVVLMQGGNYEKADRKGFVAALQAFKRFYAEVHGGEHNEVGSGVPARKAGKMGRKVHFIIHNVPSQAIAEGERGLVAPPHLVSEGLNLYAIAKMVGLPRSSYTIISRMLSEKKAAALKLAADVCLHPSKTEGFGLNVVECQALGTPVITTDFMAMRDYTKYGIAVPPRQFEEMHGGMVATPDVVGTAKALRSVFDAHQQGKAVYEAGWGTGSLQDAHTWIDDTFSAKLVAKMFVRVLKRDIGAAKLRRRMRKRREKQQRKTRTKTKTRKAAQMVTNDEVQTNKALFTVMNDNFPRAVAWDTPWTLCCHKDVELNIAMIERLVRNLLAQHGTQQLMAVMIPAKYADGRAVPVKSPAGNHVHADLPVLMRTHVYAGAVGNNYGAEKLHAVTSLATTSGGAAGVGSLPDRLDLARFTRPRGPRGRAAVKVESDVESLWGYDIPVELDEL